MSTEPQLVRCLQDINYVTVEIYYNPFLFLQSLTFAGNTTANQSSGLKVALCRSTELLLGSGMRYLCPELFSSVELSHYITFEKC
jgi:hypothetical protein